MEPFFGISVILGIICIIVASVSLVFDDTYDRRGYYYVLLGVGACPVGIKIIVLLL